MPTYTSNAGSGAPSQFPHALTEMALRGANQMLDMQMTTLRTLMETQARTAAAFGFPDCSDLFRGNGADQRLRQALSSGTEQLVGTTQRTGDAVKEIQRSVGQIVETQASTAAEHWQQGLEQLGAQTDASLKQMCSVMQQQAEQIERATRSVADAARGSLQQGGEQWRSQMQEGARRGADTVSQATEAVQKAAQAGADEKQRRERNG